MEPHQGNKDPKKNKWYREKKCFAGKKIGRWEVLMRAPNKDHLITYWCKCECGFISRVDKRSLANGRSKSCGCLKNEMNSKRLKEAWGKGLHANGRLTSITGKKQ